jgi:hypothetical protein
VNGKPLLDAKFAYKAGQKIYPIYLSSKNAAYINVAGVYQPFKNIASQAQREEVKKALIDKEIKYPE